jgi:hypothetical protein
MLNPEPYFWPVSPKGTFYKSWFLIFSTKEGSSYGKGISGSVKILYAN